MNSWEHMQGNRLEEMRGKKEQRETGVDQMSIGIGELAAITQGSYK